MGRERITHVIVLMMENRSFDHLLGYLKHDSPDYPRLTDIKPSCPEDPAKPDGRRVDTAPSASAVLGTDPDHSHKSVMRQMAGTPPMSGFIESYREKIGPTKQPWWAILLISLKRVWNWLRRRPRPIIAKPDEIMRCFPDSGVPVLGTLARQYAVMVNWHASVPGETWPNRQYAHAATSHGTANIEVNFYTDETIFERLGDAWAVYHDGVAQVWAYPKLWLEGLDHFHDTDRLIHDIEQGTLPSYAFVEPNHGYGRGEGNSQHPGNNLVSGASFRAGEALMARIYNALVANPAVFAQTLLLITYDEHGGFFDHVPPVPVVPPDKLRDKSGFDFSISGIRVPAVAVSPLIPAGTVDRTFYEHATIPAMVRRQFAPHQAPLTHRDAAANDLLDHLPLLAEARTDIRPIAFAPTAPEEGTGHPLNEFQATLVDLAGAVDVARRRVEPRARRAGPEPVVVPPFEPNPATRAAAEARVLEPGSNAEQIVSAMVADFTSDP